MTFSRKVFIVLVLFLLFWIKIQDRTCTGNSISGGGKYKQRNTDLVIRASSFIW